MSADEAFDNLLAKNELTIPVVRRRGETSTGVLERPAPAGDALRVETLLADEPSDYHPGDDGYELEERPRGLYDRPTVTDLEPVDDVSSACDHGARILGRDADGDIDEADKPLPAGSVLGQDSVLGLARRVRRFSYVPLGCMEGFENGVREMVASLVSTRPDRPSLAITSAERGEGRTELAIRIALAIAKRVGSRVLLADFDIRKPRAGTRLGVSSKYFTLSDVLRGACPLGEALIASDEDNLYVLPSRPSDRDGDEVLDNRQTAKLIDRLHSSFDFVVMDCGPAVNADAMLVCRLAGSAALAGYCGLSRAASMTEAAERIENAGARFAGVLLAGG